MKANTTVITKSKVVYRKNGCDEGEADGKCISIDINASFLRPLIYLGVCFDNDGRKLEDNFYQTIFTKLPRL